MNGLSTLQGEIARHVLPTNPKGVEAIFQFVILDAPQETFFLAADGQGVRLMPGSHDAADVKLTVGTDDLLRVLSAGIERATDYLADGRIVATGKVHLLRSISSVLQSIKESVLSPDDSLRAILRERLARRPALEAVPTIHAPAASEVQGYMTRSVPVRITGHAHHFRAATWSFADVRSALGHATAMATAPIGTPAYWQGPRPCTMVRLDAYIDSLADAKPGTPYVEFNDLPTNFPALEDYPPYYPRSVFGRPKFWLGPPHTVTPLHADWSDNIFVQLHGKKRFRLMSPAGAELVYARRGAATHDWSPVDIENPDYDAYPRAKAAKFLEVDVHAGEMLIIPAGWFHHVRGLSPSFSINYFLDGQLPQAMAETAEGRQPSAM